MEAKPVPRETSEMRSSWKRTSRYWPTRLEMRSFNSFHERPHAALGIAAAAGFILGGGLTPRRLVRLGLSVGGPSLTRQLASQALRFATDTWSAYERPAASHREPQ